MPEPLKLNGNCAAYSGNYIHSWEQELARPRYVMDKMWQNVRSNDAKTMNLDKDIEEILNTAKQTGWNGSTKTTRVWRKKKTIRN